MRYDRAGLEALARELDRPLYTLTVTTYDPFTADTPARKAAAEWFAELWHRYNCRPGSHLRRIHYLLVSQVVGEVLLRNGSPYLNTKDCFQILSLASLDARYLGLISPEDIADRRNAEPVIYLANDAADASFSTSGGLSGNKPDAFKVPHLNLDPPTILQRYHVEIWCEKSTMNDIFIPIGQRYGINVITGVGEQSLTRCIELVERARVSERPVRILYISDFDPAGMSMPVAVARKIEWRLRQQNLERLDIQVRPIVLTHEQCIEYRLPRTPIKETERRAGRFEFRFGQGATELDALEALHPGTLELILLREIMRYRDAELDGEVVEVASEVAADLKRVSTSVHKRHMLRRPRC
jgi:hypothetical protein